MMSGAVAVIWWVVLIVAVLGVVPLAWSLLHRALRAARSIERYAAETLDAGIGIAKHTQAIAALEATISAAGQLLEGVGAIARSVETVEQVLSRQKLDGGRP